MLPLLRSYSISAVTLIGRLIDPPDEKWDLEINGKFQAGFGSSVSSEMICQLRGVCACVCRGGVWIQHMHAY